MAKRKIILGTDWWTDCDDAVAIRILARAHKNKEIDLLAICINACMEHSVTSLDGFLYGEGVQDVPIGIDLKAVDYLGDPRFQTPLAPCAKRYGRNEDAEDAVRLYRKALTDAEGKVDIVEIGFLSAVKDLLLSTADDISEKTGLELVKEKVSKFWVMAGKWDEEGGKEHNICLTSRSREAADVFCDICPVPVTFLGFEIGASVISGQYLDASDNLRKVMLSHGSCNGRSSWDPMTAVLALAGDEEKAGYDTVCGTASVDASCGKNYFCVSENGSHKYVVKKHDDSYYENTLNSLIK